MRRGFKTASDFMLKGKVTKRYLIALCVEAGRTMRQAYDYLRPMVLRQEKPMVFSANIGGGRTPKPIGDQLHELRNEIGRVYAAMGRVVRPDFEAEEISPVESPEDIPPPFVPAVVEIEAEDELEELEEEAVEDVRPIAKGKRKVRDEIAYFCQAD